MKIKFNYFKILILGLGFILTSINIKAQKHNYIEKNKALASALSEKYGIPKSIILAIAFVETGGGTSINSKKLNNHFGIVGNNTPNSKYKTFSSAEESYEAFCKLVSKKKYYSSLKGNNDFSKWVQAIASAGYSTQPQEWIKRVNLINQKYLDNF